MSRPKYSAIHRERFEQIKPFVTFKMPKNPTVYEKRKIKKYYDELKPHLSRASVKYQPRNPDNLKRAKKETGLKGKQYKAFPIDAPAVGNVRVSFPKSGGMKIKHKYGEYSVVYFDDEKLAVDAENHVLDLTRPFQPNNPTYVIKCGNHLSKKNFNGKNGFKKLTETVTQWRDEYDDEDSVHHYSKWLVGFEVHNFETRTAKKDFIRERSNQTINKRTRIKNVEQKIKREKGLKKNAKRKRGK